MTLATADPRHGSVAGRVAGCDCPPCRAAWNRYKTTRHRQCAYGRWQPFVDAEPVREHLRTLAAMGIGKDRVAELSGVPEPTIGGLLYPRGRNRLPVRRCRRRTADAVLAVPATLDSVADFAYTDATGTLRRLRALVAVGWTLKELGRRLPGHPEATRLTIRNGRDKVTGQLARAARDLYNELSSTAAVDNVWTQRTRRMAAELGWPPPAAWDDDAIDDPTVEPYSDLPNPETLVDQVRAERALEGHRVELTRRERHYAVHLGQRRGMTHNAIADAIGMSLSTARVLAAKPLPEDCEVAA